MNPNSSTKGQSRLVTIGEANLMLPLVEKVVIDIVKVWDGIIQKRTELECLEKNPIRDGSGDRQQDAHELKQELNLLIDRINGYIREIEDLGCCW